MSNYSILPEHKKVAMRAAHTKWAKANPRTDYYSKTYEQMPQAKKLHRAAKGRAKDIPFDIEVEDIVVPFDCPICKQPLEVSSTRGGGPRSPSLDKVIPEKGYTKGNVAVICKMCNSVKGSYSAEMHRKIAEYIEEHITSPFR